MDGWIWGMNLGTKVDYMFHPAHPPANKDRAYLIAEALLRGDTDAGVHLPRDEEQLLHWATGTTAPNDKEYWGPAFVGLRLTGAHGNVHSPILLAVQTRRLYFDQQPRAALMKIARFWRSHFPRTSKRRVRCRTGNRGSSVMWEEVRR